MITGSARVVGTFDPRATNDPLIREVYHILSIFLNKKYNLNF